MNLLTNPQDIHSAADTWSGFIYQGKVALYHVLHLLNNDENALDYFVQLDSLEDFAIVDGLINPISLHQVKGMKSNYYSSYKGAFKKLEKRKDEFPCRDKAYFHLAMQNENTATEINSFHPKMEIYEYDDGNHYCSLIEITPKCESLIEQYLTKVGQQQRSNPDNIHRYATLLERVITDTIISVHSQNHQKDGRTISEGAYFSLISLNDFDSILRTDPSSLLDETYLLYVLKESLNRYYQEFSMELELSETIPDFDKLKLDKYLQQINGLDNKEVIQFLRRITPHREVKLNTLQDYKDNTISNDEYKDAFLQTLYELADCPGSFRENFVWTGTDSNNYTPTCIHSAQRNVEKVCRRIVKNISETDVSVPYEADKLITLEMKADSITAYLNEQTPTEADSESTNILNWSKISLVQLVDAKNQIN